MTPAMKLKIALVKLNITQVELARRTEQSGANLSGKIRADKFSISEYQRLVEALGCKLEMNIVMPDGERV